MAFDFKALGDSIFQTIQNAAASQTAAKTTRKRTKAGGCTPCAAKAAVQAAKAQWKANK